MAKQAAKAFSKTKKDPGDLITFLDELNLKIDYCTKRPNCQVPSGINKLRDNVLSEFTSSWVKSAQKRSGLISRDFQKLKFLEDIRLFTKICQDRPPVRFQRKLNLWIVTL